MNEHLNRNACSFYKRKLFRHHLLLNCSIQTVLTMAGNLSFGFPGKGRGRKRRRAGEGIDSVGAHARAEPVVAGPAQGVKTANEAKAAQGVSLFAVIPGEGKDAEDEASDQEGVPEVTTVDVFGEKAAEMPNPEAAVEAGLGVEDIATIATGQISQVAKLIERRRSKVEGGALDEDAAYKIDLDQCADDATAASYSKVPIESFGASLLKRMGWNGKPDGKSEAVAAAPVSKLTGGIQPPPLPGVQNGDNLRNKRSRQNREQSPGKDDAAGGSEHRRESPTRHNQRDDARHHMRSVDRRERAYATHASARYNSQRRRAGSLSENARPVQAREACDSDRRESADAYGSEQGRWEEQRGRDPWDPDRGNYRVESRRGRHESMERDPWKHPRHRDEQDKGNHRYDGSINRDADWKYDRSERRPRYSAREHGNYGPRDGHSSRI